MATTVMSGCDKVVDIARRNPREPPGSQPGLTTRPSDRCLVDIDIDVMAPSLRIQVRPERQADGPVLNAMTSRARQLVVVEPRQMRLNAGCKMTHRLTWLALAIVCLLTAKLIDWRTHAGAFADPPIGVNAELTPRDTICLVASRGLLVARRPPRVMGYLHALGASRRCPRALRGT